MNATKQSSGHTPFCVLLKRNIRAEDEPPQSTKTIGVHVGLSFLDVKCTLLGRYSL